VKPVRLRRIAKRDLHEAVAWYRERDPALADRFLEEVFATLGLLEHFPNIGGPVFGFHDPATRQLPVNTFPYQVIFKRLERRTAILAIAHERKKPGYWRR
jgi:plasmid stabilization system protein ParE